MYNPDIVIYHAKCADGFTSAWVFRNKYGEDDIEYYAASHGSKNLPNVKDKHVVIVDFCYKKDVLEELCKDARSLIVLDHHISAQKDIEDSSLFMISDMDFNYRKYEKLASNGGQRHFALFDMNRSGAGLAWDFCFPDEERISMVDYTEDRDLWKFKYDESKSFSAYMFSYDYTFENWDKINSEMTNNKAKCIAAGDCLERKLQKDIKELLSQCKINMVIGGHTVPVANLPYTHASDAGNIMVNEEFDCPVSGERRLPDFAACYMDTKNGRKFSLRSRRDGLDVSKIASEYGGGGHREASGFSMPIGWNGDI